MSNARQDLIAVTKSIKDPSQLMSLTPFAGSLSLERAAKLNQEEKRNLLRILENNVTDLSLSLPDFILTTSVTSWLKNNNAFVKEIIQRIFQSKILLAFDTDIVGCLSDEQIKFFANELRKNESITELQLREYHYSFKFKEDAVRILMPFLSVHPKLQSLNFDGLNPECKALQVKHFDGAFKSLNSLSFSRIAGQLSELSLHLISRPHVRRLVITEDCAYNSYVVSICEAMSANKHLYEVNLRLYGAYLNSETIKTIIAALQNNPQLAILNLNTFLMKEKQVNAFVDYVEKASTLTELYMPLMTVPFLEAMAKNKNIKTLGVEWFAKLDHSPAIMDAFFNMLSTNTSITRLYIRASLICSEEKFKKFAAAIHNNFHLIAFDIKWDIDPKLQIVFEAKWEIEIAPLINSNRLRAKKNEGGAEVKEHKRELEDGKVKESKGDEVIWAQLWAGAAGAGEVKASKVAEKKGSDFTYGTFEDEGEDEISDAVSLLKKKS